MSQLTVSISRTGQVTINVLHAHGSQCRTLTTVLEQTLGDTTHDSLKPEYVETTQTAHETVQY
jgi:DUF2997 family protein